MPTPPRASERKNKSRLCQTSNSLPVTAGATRHVKMSEFYSKFSSYIASAEDDPVCVWRYKSPVIWLVGHARWARHPKIEQFLPASHLLATLRDSINAKLADAGPKLKPIMAGTRMHIAPEPLVRALLIRVLYSIPSDDALREVINYNMLYRWFAGFDLSEPLWSLDVMTETFALLLSSRDVVNLLCELVAMSMAVTNQVTIANDFHVNLALLEAWRVRLDNLGPPSSPPNPAIAA